MREALYLASPSGAVSSNTYVAAMQRGEKALAASGDAETCAPSQHPPEGRDASGDQWGPSLWDHCSLSGTLTLYNPRASSQCWGHQQDPDHLKRALLVSPQGVVRKLKLQSSPATHSLGHQPFPFLGSAQKGIDSCWGENRSKQHNIRDRFVQSLPERMFWT